MVQIEEDTKEKVKSLLRELFQFDNQDLDFGIYRIMNFKRKEIEKFIEQDLIAEAERQFQEYSQASKADLKNEVDRLRTEIVRDFGEGTLDSEGNVKKNEDAPKVKQYLDTKRLLEEAKLTQSQVSDVFNHIYEFFSRYYDKGDFIPKRRYGGKSKYYIPYNGEEVAFYWATKDMYYVKTGEFFKKYSFRAGGYLVTFTLTEAKVEAGNVKGKKKYFIISPDNPVTIDDATRIVEIRFNYRGLLEEETSKFGKSDIQGALIKSALEQITHLFEGSSIAGVLKPRVEGEKSLMEKHLNTYVDRNTKDYFVHKNLRGFLEDELDFYLKSEVWRLNELKVADENGAKLLSAKAKAIHNISAKIIEFLSQIEDFQKKLFEKKKLVLKTQYIVTTDKLSHSLIARVLNNKAQLEEWEELGFGRITNEKDLVGATRRLLNGQDSIDVKKLPVDTKYFDEEFKYELLDFISEKISLDNQTVGLIVKSENWQALNLMENKYKDKIKCIYIDPPYNRGDDDGFLYKDNYQHSTWASMTYDRMNIAKQYLGEDGYISISIGDEERGHLQEILEENYGVKNYLGIVSRITKKGGNAGEFFTPAIDYLLFFAANKDHCNGFREPVSDKTLNTYKEKDEIGRFKWRNWYDASLTLDRSRNARYGIRSPKGDLIFPPEGKRWRNVESTFIDKREKDEIKFVEKSSGHINEYGKPSPWSVFYKLRPSKSMNEGVVPDNFIDDCPNSLGTLALSNLGLEFSFSKPVELIEKIIAFGTTMNTSEDHFVFDFFAGSGTTGQAVLQINKKLKKSNKFIMVEMGEYFDSIILPRIKKLCYSLEWKDGKPQNIDGQSGLFEYILLEQYEDTLNNIILMDKDKTVQETLDGFEDYFLRYMLDYETKESPTRLMVDRFVKPFDYKIRIINSTEEKTVAVDLVETFNYLLGLKVEKFRRLVDNERIYKAVYGKLENKSVCVIWRDIDQIDPETDKAFIQNKILAGKGFDLIYVNGDSYVQNARPIEPEFKRLMGA